ncbi:hypothetical protein [Nostoc parmelioides]|jgi:nitrate/nitrite transporter NarK|uniref:hypothetical protein n=1 Tax=Nostoc parmelioides TaxID=1521621 RepID=UPI00059CBB95|nr:hypothetical protein [Nostoc parmelioides]QFZ12549.1 hypothetical protein EH233_11290 [Anabaena sp. YBS01]
MQDSAFTIFIAFGCIWILIGAVGLIAVVKSEGQKLRFDKWGLIVLIPIIVPIVVVLLYQVLRPLFR